MKSDDFAVIKPIIFALFAFPLAFVSGIGVALVLLKLLFDLAGIVIH